MPDYPEEAVKAGGLAIRRLNAGTPEDFARAVLDAAAPVLMEGESLGWIALSYSSESELAECLLASRDEAARRAESAKTEPCVRYVVVAEVFNAVATEVEER